MASTPSRMIRLLSLLQTCRGWPGPELAARLGVSPRTLRRDIDRLRELGYPVRAAPGMGGGYRLEAGTAMPPLVLDDEEAVAIAISLRTAAGGTVAGIEETSVRALAKLEQVLPGHLRRRVSALQGYTVPLTSQGPAADPEVLTVIAQACRDRERLKFAYRKRDGEDGTRLVEPYRLVHLARKWYLVAWDVNRDDWRTFRADRLTSPAPAGQRFRPRELPAPDIARYVAESVTSSLARHRAVVTLHAPFARVAERLRPQDGVLTVVDERTCRLHTAADSLQWLALTLGMFDVDFEVHEPPELIAYIRTLTSRLSRATPA
ncbi:helix-turn-helix transcriptional regulator [Nonomuraea roseoviolacea]|uniref:DNA-binding transcriptional regulator YafY n=1 Tax=Nonomuraea roseoviolacea subsp. carminata TaxID=160689 RepID=A0ABT1KEY2_9ACTN|nr:YafY family protein [Nonomuraea roseoviolacea]MCP2352577.1 putative DNA-binding transcriptional regulator YafY [Nonomuraea roseoviolacea subsp. carminata]